MARVLQPRRPSLDVPVTGAGAFADEGSRLRPNAGIPHRPRSVGGAAWVRVPTPRRPGIYVGGRCRSLPNPSFDELLAVVDETAAPSG